MTLLRAVDILAGKVSLPQKHFTCAKCDTPLRESVTGCRKLSNGEFNCSDCYFEDFGDAIEAFPIVPPRTPRA